MKPGDPITVVDGDLLVHVRANRWLTKEDDRDYIETRRRGVAGIVVGPTLEASDEYSTWCRGHVTPKDEAGAALLAASAMKPTRAIPLDVAEGAYRRGLITEEAWRKNLDQWDAEFAAGERDR